MIVLVLLDVIFHQLTPFEFRRRHWWVWLPFAGFAAYFKTHPKNKN
jgi:hypothetical protein